MSHWITIIETVIGKSYTNDKHQVIIDFTIFSGNLYLGIKHFTNDTFLPATKNKNIKKLVPSHAYTWHVYTSYVYYAWEAETYFIISYN